jgi:hypothetical protein
MTRRSVVETLAIMPRSRAATAIVEVPSPATVARRRRRVATAAFIGASFSIPIINRSVSYSIHADRWAAVTNTKANTATIHAGGMFNGFVGTGPVTLRIEDATIIDVDLDGHIPRSEITIDYGPRAWLLPGLIDSHVHLSFDAGPNPVESVKVATDVDLIAGMRAAAQGR